MRALFMEHVPTGNCVLVLYRPKGDPVGDNMSEKNPEFGKAVESNLKKYRADADAGNIAYFDLKDDSYPLIQPV
ncbi:MAG: hypothetical protein JOZ81_31065 [Chloroflexi bacterium]|nr:hypothetical protein [Chloroflexota bacterium]